MSPEINLTIRLDYKVYIIKNWCAKCDLEKCTIVEQIPIVKKFQSSIIN